MAFVWHAPDSQIYPELRKMAKEGWLLAAEEISWGPNGKKTQYRITPEGRGGRFPAVDEHSIGVLPASAIRST